MLRPTLPLNTVLIKPAGPDCNLVCRYCFYLEKDSLFPNRCHRMGEETLTRVIRQAMDSPSPDLSFIWQGGEPTLMGVPFFKKAVALQKEYGRSKSVTNSLQTNGTLLNDEWIEFFRAENFLIGLSLDGPEPIHDHHRKTVSGSGSWKIVSANGRALLEAGVMVNAVSCVTAHSAGHVAEAYKYLKSEGYRHMQFIPVVEPNGKKDLAPFSVTPQQYGDFLCELFDLWRGDFEDGRPTTSIRQFDTLFFTLLGHPAPECGSRMQCGLYLAVEHNGDVFPCDFFIEPAHRLGSVHTDTLAELFNSKRQRMFGAAKGRLGQKCQKCEWLNLCGGGCLKDRRNNPAGFETSYFCPSLKKFYAHAVPAMTDLAKRWQG